MASFAPREVLTAARLNAALGEKADTAALTAFARTTDLAGKADLIEGVLRSDQVPPAITQGIASAQSAADTAGDAAEAAQADATAAGQAAVQAQQTADGAARDVSQAKQDAAEALQASSTAATDASKAKSDAASALSSRIPTSQRGVANGVAALDGTGRVPLSQLPDGIGGGGGSNPDAWMTPPKASDFVWVNGGVSTATDTPTALEIVLEGATSQTLRALTRPRPSARWRAVVCIEHPALVALNVGAGLACRSSVSGRVEHSCWINGIDSEKVFNRQLLALRWTSTTAVQSTLSSRGVITAGRLFQRLTDNGSTLVHEVSLTGKEGTWMVNANSSRTEFVDADEISIAFASIVALSYPTRVPFRITHFSLEALP